MCEHLNFEASVRVARTKDKGRFLVEIRIVCKDCGAPMQFMGFEPGLDYNGATVSLDGLEACMGIHPRGQQPTPYQKLIGYKVCN